MSFINRVFPNSLDLLQASEQCMERVCGVWKPNELPGINGHVEELLHQFTLLKLEDKSPNMNGTIKALQYLHGILSATIESQKYVRSAETQLPKHISELAQKIQAGVKIDTGSDILGRGNFGIVWKGAIDALPFAYKKVLSVIPDEIDKLHKEASLLISLNHPNIIKLAGVTLADDGGSPTVCLEFANRGSLAQNMEQGKLDVYQMNNVVHIMTGIGSGLMYLHANGIVHADLHAGNIMLHQMDEGSLLEPKIIDLEKAYTTEESAIPSIEEEVGLFHPPEILALNPEKFRRIVQKLGSKKKQNKGLEEAIDHTVLNSLNIYRSGALEVKDPYKRDVWPFGMIVFNLLNKGKNIYEVNHIQHPNEIARCRRFGDSSYLVRALTKNTPSFPCKDALVIQLIQQVVAPCLQMLPDQRPATETLVPIIANIQAI